MESVENLVRTKSGLGASHSVDVAQNQLQRFTGQESPSLEDHSVSSASNASKLAELRAKTDRQLSILVRREMERALVLANVAATRESPLYEQAETAYTRLKALLPRIGGMSRDERALMEANLKELRAALDWVSAQRIQRHAAFVA